MCLKRKMFISKANVVFMKSLFPISVRFLHHSALRLCSGVKSVHIFSSNWPNLLYFHLRDALTRVETMHDLWARLDPEMSLDYSYSSLSRQKCIHLPSIVTKWPSHSNFYNPPPTNLSFQKEEKTSLTLLNTKPSDVFGLKLLVVVSPKIHQSAS